MLWLRSFDGPAREIATSVEETTDGGYVVAGFTLGASHDIYLVKTNASGFEEWSRVLGRPDSDAADVAQLSCDGGYVLLGETTSWDPARDVCILKTDGEGRQLAFRDLGLDNTYDLCLSGQRTSDCGFIAVGHVFQNEGTPDEYHAAYLVKTDADGRRMWSRLLRVEENLVTYGDCVHQTMDGGYVIGGETKYPGPSKACVLKTDAMGLKEWSKTLVHRFKSSSPPQRWSGFPRPLLGADSVPSK